MPSYARAPTCFIISSCCGWPRGYIPTTSGRRWTGASGYLGSPRSCRNSRLRFTHAARWSRSNRRARANGVAADGRAARGQLARPSLNQPAMLRRLYDWCIAAADKPYASWLLGLVSFVESSFFPIPPDAMLIPMALARPDKAWSYATLCTATSVAGGVLGYLIRALLYDSVGLWLIQLYGYGNKVEAFREAYAQWGGWIILLKGLTPIPYKIVTIASGFAGYNLPLFVLLSCVARGMRFFLLAFLLNRYGAQARLIIEERLTFWVTLAAIVLVAGIIAALYLFWWFRRSSMLPCAARRLSPL